MNTVAFSQDVGQIIQMAYVAKDIRTSVEWWTPCAQTGPCA